MKRPCASVVVALSPARTLAPSKGLPVAASNTWPGISSACTTDSADSVNKPASKLADGSEIRIDLLPRLAFAEKFRRGHKKTARPGWASGAYAVRTASVSLRWHDPVQVRRVSILRPAAEPPPTEAIYLMSLQYRARPHSGQCAPLRSLFPAVRPAGLPHDQRRFQSYLPRRVLPLKLFQHQLHRRLGNLLIGSC